VDTQLRNFLDTECQVKVDDIVCESCDKSAGCPTCKQANAPSSIQKMIEDERIKQALVVSPAGDGKVNKGFHWRIPSRRE
jgi:hypothetical protein